VWSSILHKQHLQAPSPERFLETFQRKILLKEIGAMKKIVKMKPAVSRKESGIGVIQNIPPRTVYFCISGYGGV